MQQNGCGKFNDLDEQVLQSIKDFGVTHVWYTGVLEHATLSDYANYGMPADHPLVVKGVAGSPYAIRDFYQVDPDLASDPGHRFDEFKALVKRTQQAGLKTIIDFIPNHVARYYQSHNLPEGETNLGATDQQLVHFSAQNNFYYFPQQAFRTPEGFFPPYAGQQTADTYKEEPAKATGNDCFTASPGVNDWFETVKLNYGVDYMHGRTCHFEPIPDTWLKMKAILLFWCRQDVDGFRCDMVELVPVEFWAWVIPAMKKEFPDIIFIGEVYNPSLYVPYLEAGFDYLYDKVGHYDAVRELIEGKGNANHVYDVHETQQGFQHKMLKFIENHDEQRLASEFVATDMNRGIVAHAACLLMHKGPTMIYFGQELGEKAEGSTGFSGNDGKTTIFDYWPVPTVQQWLQHLAGSSLPADMSQLRQQYQQLNLLALQREALISGKYYSIQWANAGKSFNYNEHKVLCFLRYTENEKLLIVLNFESNQQVEARIKIPYDAWKALGLPAVGLYNVVSLLEPEAAPLSFYAEAVTEQHNLHAGVIVSLKPWKPLIFELIEPN